MKKSFPLAAIAAALIIVGAGCAVKPTPAPAPQAAAPAPAPAPAPSIQVGTSVIANWKKGNHWYPGKVSAMAGGTFDIAFNDGDKEAGLSADRVTFAPTGAAVTVAVGDAVIGKWSDGQWYTATVTSVAGSQVGLKFYDGFSRTVSNTEVVKAPGAVAAAPAAVVPAPAPTPAAVAPAPAAAPVSFTTGAAVLAKWKGGNHWYKGKVSATKGSAFDIAFNDGDKEAGLAIERLAHFGKPVAGLKVGDAVVAKWTNGEYYDATVTAVAGDAVSVKFYDGFKLDVSAAFDLALAGK